MYNFLKDRNTSLPLELDNIVIVKQVGPVETYEEITQDEMVIRDWQFGTSTYAFSSEFHFTSIRPAS